jgi:NADP-dependent 3-hydroxy acid dehydrogenase YdfG
MATQRVAMVTGAGTGIGKASAYALLEDGWSVVFAGRRKDVLDQAVAESNAGPARTLAVPTNVGDPASVAALFDATKAGWTCCSTTPAPARRRCRWRI